MEIELPAPRRRYRADIFTAHVWKGKRMEYYQTTSQYPARTKKLLTLMKAIWPDREVWAKEDWY